MTTRLTKEHVPFLAAAMDKKHGIASDPDHTPVQIAAPEDIKGPMSIPEPVSVDVKGDMSVQDYEKCSLIMAVCTNMVQQTISNAAINSGIPISDALKNMDAWVTGFTTFPFPFFTFTSQQDDNYKKADFSLQADPDVVDQILNIKNVVGLKDAVIGALNKKRRRIRTLFQTRAGFQLFWRDHRL